MQKLLIKFQEAAFQMDPQSLWIPACIAIVLGLFLWLGGTRYASFVIGILGAGAGATCGILISHWFGTDRMLTVVIASAVVSIIAVLLKRMVIAVLAMAIFAITCGSTYMGFHISEINWQNVNQTKNNQALDQSNPEPGDDLRTSRMQPAPTPLTGELYDQTDYSSTPETKERNTAFHEIKNILKTTASNNTFMLILWIVLGALIGLAVAHFLRKIIMAFCCSTVGATAILLGLITVFLAKQTPVVDTIIDRPNLAPTVFGVMILMGFVSQLVFAKKPKPETEDEDE